MMVVGRYCARLLWVLLGKALSDNDMQESTQTHIIYIESTPWFLLKQRYYITMGSCNLRGRPTFSHQN